MVLFRKQKESCGTDRIIQLTIIHGNNDTGDHPGKIFMLQCGNNFIGRDHACEVILKSGTVSRRHANLKVSYDKKKLTIVDLGSSNGILFPPSTVIKKNKKSLNSGDEFQVGEILFKIFAIDQDESLKTMTIDVKKLLKQQGKKRSS